MRSFRAYCFLFVEVIVYRVIPVIVALFVGFLVYNALDRRLPVRIVSGEVHPAVVVAGTEASIRWEMVWSRSDCEGTVEPELVTAENIVWSYAAIHTYGPTNLDGVERAFYVPHAITPGKIRYRGRVFFVCNWFQNLFPLVLTIPDVEFTVVAPK